MVLEADPAPVGGIGRTVTHNGFRFAIGGHRFFSKSAEVVARDRARRETLHLVGRNGMHRYNNQDHAMMTAMLAVRNILAGAAMFDLWGANEDAEYHEAGAAGEKAAPASVRLMPARMG